MSENDDALSKANCLTIFDTHTRIVRNVLVIYLEPQVAIMQDGSMISAI